MAFWHPLPSPLGRKHSLNHELREDDLLDRPRTLDPIERQGQLGGHLTAEATLLHVIDALVGQKG